MNIMKKVRTLMKIIIMKGTFNNLNDESYLKLLYWTYMGKKLDLKNPERYTEKLQWQKLYDRKDTYTKMVDKYEAKCIVASIIGNEHIIPTLGVWDSAKEIDFEDLPEKFVLKTTHDSGGVKIIDKAKGMNKEEIVL